MQKNNNSIVNKKHLKKQFILLIIIFVYMLSISVTLGRYALDKVSTYLSASKEFYFYSDKLSEKEIDYPINWSGTEECIIPINLYTKMNSLKKATHDVKYKVEYELLSSNAICKLSKDSGIVSAETNNDVFTLSISPNSLLENDDKITVKVNVTTVDDFEKTLTAKFIISIQNESVSYKIDDAEGRPYFNLIINNMQRENVTLTFNPNDILIDTTNDIFSNLNSYELLPGTKYINRVDFILNARANLNIRFYKKDKMQNYTNDEDIIEFEHEQI